MSETAATASAAQSVRLAPARSRRSRLSSLEALERGFALFRSTFPREAWRYYTGAAPLVLCSIPIWVTDGQIHVSDGALLMQAVLLGLAYMLRAWMVGSYVERVREHAFGVPILKLVGAVAQAAATGRLLAWKITLSAAAVATLPTIAAASWFYSACQFAGLEAREDGAERHSFGGCLALSSQWFGSGVLLFLMLFPLWGAVWLNGFILAVILPHLLHSIFGVSTLLSTRMGLFSLLQSSAFWLALFAGAWLAVDPIVKCTYVIVYQHLRSRREGDDLRGLLASLPREQKDRAELIGSTGTEGRAMLASLVLLATILIGTFQTASARAQASPNRSSATTVGSTEQMRIQKLRKALNEESQRAIYRWHDAEHSATPTWFDKLLEKIGQAIKRGWTDFRDFLRRLWPQGLSFGNEKGTGWHLKDLRLWVALVALLTLVAGALLIWRRRRRESVQLSIPIATAPLPDLADVAVASERSEDEWFALANRLETEGELRLALRAAYLGLLAGLAQREWLTIRRDRTNRDYLDEFTRRWRRRPQAGVEALAEIPEKLRGSLRQFDHVWYGLHALTPTAVAAYCRAQRELLNHV
jgi:hypothetical protein